MYCCKEVCVFGPKISYFCHKNNLPDWNKFEQCIMSASSLNLWKLKCLMSNHKMLINSTPILKLVTITITYFLLIYHSK